MNKKQKEISSKCILDLIALHTSMRDFCRHINQDVSDVSRWKLGKTKIRVDAVVTICKLFGVRANTLRPDIFTDDVELIFKKK
jgi:hypothetical protein